MYSVDSSGNLLSPLNIPDPLIRAELMRQIRLAQTDSKYRKEGEWTSYVVQPADTLSPEFIAYKEYGIDTLKWLVQIASGLDDTRERLEAGTVLYLPTTLWLRERVREYTEFCSSGSR